MSEIRSFLNNQNKKDNIQEGMKDIAEFLWTFYAQQDSYNSYQEKIHQYRKKLGKHITFEILNAHRYVPHPVKVECNQKKRNVFGLISIHTDIGAKKDNTNNIALMTFREAIHSDKRENQRGMEQHPKLEISWK